MTTTGTGLLGSRFLETLPRLILSLRVECCSLSWVRHVELTVDEGHGTKSTFVSFSEIQE